MKNKDSKRKRKASLEAGSQAALDNVTGGQSEAKSVPGSSVATGSPSAGDASASSVKEEITPKQVFNTKKVAQLVGGGAAPSVGVAAPVLRAAGRVNYSGSADNVIGDNSAIAKGAGIVKSGDRPGRQIDTALQHIDDAPAETFIVPVETIPQLTDGQSAVGYNGKYRNAHAISQKGSGGSPADSDFFRTLDECQFDNIYFANGQVNGLAGDKMIEGSTYNKSTKSHDSIKTVPGNYVARKLVVTFDKDKNLESLAFSVDDLTEVYTDADDAILRASGDSLLREKNKSELDRLAMIEKAGDETKEDWSPLGRVIPNARATNQIIGELDKTIGDYMYLSGQKLMSALAYQNNKAAKDGLRKVAPIFEMLEGNCEGTTYRFNDAGFDGESGTPSIDSLFYHKDKDSGSDVYNANMGKGSAAMYIAINDSTQKYNSKGKVLSLPLSFKTAVSTFKQNCGEFRAHKTFIDEFNRQEVFGKIDEDGSGITPTFISDGAAISSFINIFGSIPDSKTSAETNIFLKDSAADPIVTIHYEDLRNEYNSHVYNYFLKGLKDYISRNKERICQQLQKGAVTSNKYIWEVPVVSTTTCLSMWDVLLCAASKDIAVARRYAMDEIIKYEANHGYPYHDAVKFSEVTFGPLANIGFSDITEPLQTRPIPLTVGVRLMMPELFWVKSYGKDTSMGDMKGWDVGAHEGTVGSIVLPWYFSQNAFSITQEDPDCNHLWTVNPEGINSMTFFDFRGGVTFGNADRIKAMDPEQIKLCLDRMVIAPGMSKQISELEDTALYPTVYKYSYHEDGIPVLLAYVASSSSSDTDHRITIRDILKTPRELGLSMIAPSGYVTGNFDGTDLNYRDVDSAYFVVSGPSFRIRCWSSTPKASVGSNLFDQTRSSSYAVNLQAHYYVIYAQANMASTDIGLKLTCNGSGGNILSTEGINPEVDVESNTEFIYESGTYKSSETKVDGISDADVKKLLSSAKVVSMLKYFYTRVNYLPFIINPFDVNTKAFTGSETSDSGKMVACNFYDIYDFLHMYNMCGFRCGEYQAIASERDRSRIELGLGYTQDPYIERRL